MRFIAYTFLFLLIAIPVAVGGAAYLAVSDTPTVNRATEFTPAHIERAKRIVDKNDPRTMKAGALRTIALSQEDADLALNYLAGRYMKASSRVALQPGTAAISLSIELPGNPLGRFLNIAAVPRPIARKVLLAGREDFPQHFTISAAIAANAGAPLSDAIGLYKEVDDSHGGSGFSFNDIAGDRAGTRFGELAAGSRETALKLQRAVSAGVRDADILPPVADLPEFMPEPAFKRRYGGIGARPYKTMMDDIERRVAALPLYR